MILRLIQIWLCLIKQNQLKKVQFILGQNLQLQTEVEADTDVEETDEEDEDSDYAERARPYSYAGDVERVKNAPYVIHPDLFGTREDYDTRSLKCFADRVVTDTDNEIVDDVDNLIGDESLDHFGEFEFDSVFVRNEKLKCDYEILLDSREYSDVMKEMTHQVED